MAEPNRLQDKMADAARAVWVDAARDILIAGGVSALNLRGLSASLGVTTGAFYSVFSGLEDLHDALRQRWLDQNVTPMIEAIEAAGRRRVPAIPCRLAGDSSGRRRRPAL
jgi:AcrR family transcriptional regulator